VGWAGIDEQQGRQEDKESMTSGGPLLSWVLVNTGKLLEQ
jgi:hypothetical protein